MLSIKVLGTPTIVLHNQLVALKTYKSQALLFYLAVNLDLHQRDRLATFLWSEMAVQQARKNLREALGLLRATFGDYIQADREWVTFNQHQPYHLDLTEFVQQLTAARASNDLAGV